MAGDYLFIERPSLTAAPAEHLAEEAYTKLLAIWLNPYCITSVSAQYFTLWPDEIENTGSTNRVSKVPILNEDKDDDITSKGSRSSHECQPHEPREERGKEYATEGIASYKRSKNGMLYRVWWYGYAPADDNHEPTLHIPSPLIHWYWERQIWKKENCSLGHGRSETKKINKKRQSTAKMRCNQPSNHWHSP